MLWKWLASGDTFWPVYIVRTVVTVLSLWQCVQETDEGIILCIEDYKTPRLQSMIPFDLLMLNEWVLKINGVIPLWRRPLWRMPVWRFHYGVGPAWRIPVWRVPVRRRSGVALFQFGAFQYGAGPVRRISLWRSSGLALRSIVVNVPCRV